MKQATILLLEGQAAGDRSVEPGLERAGYHIRKVSSVKEAFGVFERESPVLVILDCEALPKRERQRCEAFLKATVGTPSLQIEQNRPDAKSRGPATVYLRRPLRTRRLLIQVRRYVPAGDETETMLRVGDVALLIKRRVVVVGGKKITYLTPRKAALLALLMRQPNVVVSRKEIMKRVWQTDFMGDTRTLDVHIRWVRMAIEESPDKPTRLMTVRGKGYVFHPHVTG